MSTFLSSYSMDKTAGGAEYELMPDPIEKADFTPLRLTLKERKLHRLMCGIVMASHYTDKVDNETVLKSNKRDFVIAREIINVFRGFVSGLDAEKGLTLLRDRQLLPFEHEIQSGVELCRRYKMMNPDLLRTSYVKFLYMIQDAVSKNMQEMLGFCVSRRLVTVGGYCCSLRCSEMLKDSRLPLCVTPVPPLKNRSKLNKALRHKDLTVNALVREYAKNCGQSSEAVELAVRSLNDANHFANDNVVSINQLLQLLKENFSQKSYDETSDLSIEAGENGSRLSHKHERQFVYVLQSLTLWRNICQRMYTLWIIAEEDMLNPDEPYEFRCTGQGYQRVQRAPNLFKAILEVVKQTKEELGEWIGSDRIHLGDDQVPNAFHFIDKYGQISRIIIPILRTIAHIDKLQGISEHNDYIKEVWGSAANAKRAIMRDFFQHGFDGSGGDNLDDAGSCVDGRLTSAWNWCNSIRSKPFFPLFRLAGFSSFDGDLSL